MKSISKGFTLIELLIVIAILGVLATVVLVAINPQEQLARARDSGRKTAANQLGHVLQAYATGHDGTIPDESATWIDDLVTAGALNTAPQAIAYGSGSFTPCATNEENNFCYSTDGSAPPNTAIVYIRLEANADISKCAPGESAWMVFDTHAGSGGVVCSVAEPVFDPAGQTYVN